MYVYIYQYTYTHIYIYICQYTYTYAYIYIHTYRTPTTSSSICMSVCALYTYTYTYISTHTYIYIYICIHTHMHIYTYIHIECLPRPAASAWASARSAPLQYTGAPPSFWQQARAAARGSGNRNAQNLSCSALQLTATHCMQQTATHRSSPFSTASTRWDTRIWNYIFSKRELSHAATRCNILQHIATHCNTLQHTITRCKLIATHWIWQRGASMLLCVEREDLETHYFSKRHLATECTVPRCTGENHDRADVWKFVDEKQNLIMCI